MTDHPTPQAQAELSDERLIELAREYTFFNGSHAMTNYPAFARAAIAEALATRPTEAAPVEADRVALDALDAKRYRWMRTASTPAVCKIVNDTAEGMDASIDAAIASEGGAMGGAA